MGDKSDRNWCSTFLFTSDVLHSRNQAPPRKNGRYSEPSAHSRPAHYVSRDVPKPEWSGNETKQRLGQTLLIIGSPCAISLCVKEPSLAGDGGGAALLHVDKQSHGDRDSERATTEA